MKWNLWWWSEINLLIQINERESQLKLQKLSAPLQTGNLYLSIHHYKKLYNNNCIRPIQKKGPIQNVHKNKSQNQ